MFGKITAQKKLQKELASLNYELSRLVTATSVLGMDKLANTLWECQHTVLSMLDTVDKLTD